MSDTFIAGFDAHTLLCDARPYRCDAVVTEPWQVQLNADSTE